jgi:hypothetical protein
MPKGNHNNHARGANHPRWNSGELVSTAGYLKVRVGIGHPLADPYGYAYEHLVVWAAAGNTLPGKHELIHHINGDKRDNRLQNLECIQRSEHSKQHVVEASRDALGRFVKSQSIQRQKADANV